jgi:transposase-like protein
MTGKKRKLRCPLCKSTNLHKYGVTFEGEFFECLDCDEQFLRRWNGEIEVLSK